LEGTPTQKCGNCGNLGHASKRCYAQRKAEAPVKLLAFDAEKKAMWPGIVTNHRGEGKVATPLKCRETG